MLSFIQGGRPGAHRHFLIRHGLVWPLTLALLATWLRHSGGDEGASALFFDTQAQHFVAGRQGWVEWLGHRASKSAVLAVWLLMLASAAAACLPVWPSAWSRYRPVLWATALAMGLGPALVAGSLFSVVRMAQGAHFLSHNLWSAAIDWWVAALVFSPLLLGRTPPGGAGADLSGQELQGGVR